MPKEIVIYTMDGCPYCERAKKLLCQKGAPYCEINLSDQEYRWEECERRSGRESVPQIYFDGRHIGGFDDLLALDESGRLDGLLFPEKASIHP